MDHMLHDSASYVKGYSQSLWEWATFNPRQILTSWPIITKVGTTCQLYERVMSAKNGWNRLTGSRPPNMPNITHLWGFSPWYCYLFILGNTPWSIDWTDLGRQWLKRRGLTQGSSFLRCGRWGKPFWGPNPPKAAKMGLQMWISRRPWSCRIFKDSKHSNIHIVNVIAKLEIVHQQMKRQVRQVHRRTVSVSGVQTWRPISINRYCATQWKWH